MTATFSDTVILGKGPWWIAYTLEGGGTATLVEGSLAKVKSWSRSKYGTSVQFPGTSVNVNPGSGAGFGGSSTAVIIGPFASQSQAVSEASSGNYGSGVGSSGNETSAAQSIPGISAITKWLGQSSIWLRGAEIVAGLLILYVGLKAVTAPQGTTVHQIGAQSVKSTVKKVIK
jgi:hypothetical protein